MKKLKKMAVISLALCVLFVVGCSGKEKLTPDITATSLFNLYIKGDKEAVAKMKISKEDVDAIAKIQKDTAISLLKTSLTSTGIQVTDEKLEEFYNAREEVLKKLNCTAEVISQTKESAEVKIKSTYINEDALAEKAANDALETIKQMGLTDENEAVSKFGDEYIKNSIMAYQSAEPSQDTKEKTFKFTKQDGIWLPESSVEFGNSIGLLIAGQ